MWYVLSSPSWYCFSYRRQLPLALQIKPERPVKWQEEKEEKKDVMQCTLVGGWSWYEHTRETEE